MRKRIELYDFKIKKLVYPDDTIVPRQGHFEGICALGYEDIAILMVKSESIGLNSKGRKGTTPTYWTAHYGMVKMVHALVTAGADINQGDGGGATPLLMASYKGHLPVVHYLVTMGADVNHTSDYGWSPLLLARHQGRTDLASYLEEAEATT